MLYKFVFATCLFFGVILNGQSSTDNQFQEVELLSIRAIHPTERNLSQEVKDIWAMADKYRRHPIITWWYHVGSLVSNNADDVINLHHVAGNIQHIISALVSDKYYQHIRRCEWSQNLREVDMLWGGDARVITLRADDGDMGNRMVWDYHFLSDYKLPANLVVGRDCIHDLWSCVDIMREFDSLWQQKASVPKELHKRLEYLEIALAPYRTQRKLSFKSIYARNKGKCGHDDDVPDSICFNEADFSGKKFERAGLPFYGVVDK